MVNIYIITHANSIAREPMCTSQDTKEWLHKRSYYYAECLAGSMRNSSYWKTVRTSIIYTDASSRKKRKKNNSHHVLLKERTAITATVLANQINTLNLTKYIEKKNALIYTIVIDLFLLINMQSNWLYFTQAQKYSLHQYQEF